MQPWQSDLLYHRAAVTGGGSGIGRGVALQLAELGATVYVLGRRVAALEETAQLADKSPGRIVPLSCDVRDATRVNDAFERIEQDGGPVQALVHCAASVQYVPAVDLTSESFREVVNSILMGSFHALHRWGVPLLKSQQPGVGLVLTSAIASRGTPGIAHSSSAKAGVEALVKSLAREWGPAGVRINAVGPGFFPVERTRAMFEPGQPGAAIVDMTALGRLGRLDEIVGPIVFLLTEAGSYFTGEVVIPDGGFRLTPQVIPRWRF
jgi:NAD(P)-dependent dehydrogenase (short-subunit alcohol dehydrogenase family)